MSRRGAGPLAVPRLLAAATAGAASPPQAEIPCARTGGPVRVAVTSERGDIAFPVDYPRSVGSYLGGFTAGTKKTSADLEFYLDVDADPKTGMKGDPVFAAGAAGSGYSIDTPEVETSVAKNAAGEWIQKPVLTVMVQKPDEFFDLPGGISPKWEMETDGRRQPIDGMRVPDSRTMRLAFPWSAIGGKPGTRVRVTAVVPICHDEFPFPRNERDDRRSPRKPRRAGEPAPAALVRTRQGRAGAGA